MLTDGLGISSPPSAHAFSAEISPPPSLNGPRRLGPTGREGRRSCVDTYEIMPVQKAMLIDPAVWRSGNLIVSLGAKAPAFVLLVVAVHDYPALRPAEVRLMMGASRENALRLGSRNPASTASGYVSGL